MLGEWLERRSQVLGVLDELSTLAKNLGATALGDRLADDVAARLRADRFHLVVVGEFNHGKSTLINALLGAPVLPAGVTPTTALVQHVAYAEAPELRVVSTSGERRGVPFADIVSYSAEGGPAEGIRRLEIGYPADVLRERLVLVDTPGVNDLSLLRAEVTYGYIPEADAVLFVLDAGQPVKESERRFFEERLSACRDKVVFAIAKADLWDAAEREEAMAYVRRQLSSLVAEPAIYPVSAAKALRGDRDGSGVAALEAGLSELVTSRRGELLLRGAIEQARQAAALLAHGLEARRRIPGLDQQETARRITVLEQRLAGHGQRAEQRRAELVERVAALRARVAADARAFTEQVEKRLPEMLAGESADDVRQHLGPYLEHALATWAERESEMLAGELSRLTHEVEVELVEDVTQMTAGLSSAMQHRILPRPIDSDSFPYDVGIFAVFSLGVGFVFSNVLLGGMLLAAAPVLALWNRERAEVVVRRRAIEGARAALHEAAARITERIDQALTEYARRIERWVLLRTEEMHEQALRLLAELRAEREGKANGTHSHDELYAAQLDGVFDRLAAAEGRRPP